MKSHHLKAEGYLDALGFNSTKDFINGDCEVGLADRMGSGPELEYKKDTD
ncbi:hypothetical protein UT300005_13740 [Clostridium sp. CTA-5]